MNDRQIIPLETYPGRKAAAGAWQKIISEIPKCDLFIEAMCGSAFISSLVAGCSIVINDIDRSVIDKIICGSRITKLNKSFPELIDIYDNDSSRNVFYFDPPYLMETRFCKERIYKYDWSDTDHFMFLGRVIQMKSPVMVSHYPCEMYDTCLSHWRKVQYNSMTRAGVRVENLYMNYPPPVLLQCFGSVGENFTDRQRIKRKVDRLVLRLQNEKPKDRAAILSSILDKFNYASVNNSE